MNLIGREFGRLKVVANDRARPGYVICECKCGNKVSVRSYSLTKKQNPTQSCGCIRKEIVSEIGRRTIHDNSARRIETNMRYNTNFQIIESEEPAKNNKSGYKGVWYDPARGKYEAYITLHRKKICLGRFSKLEDAVKARKAAEDELFAPLISAKRAESRSAIAIAR